MKTQKQNNKRKLGLAALCLSASMLVGSIGTGLVMQPDLKKAKIERIVPEASTVLRINGKLKDMYSHQNFVDEYDELVQRRDSYEKQVNSLMEKPGVIGALKEIKNYERLKDIYLPIMGLAGLQGMILSGLYLGNAFGENKREEK